MADDELRVLLLAGRFEVRGTSKYTLRLASHLPEHGVQPLVVTTDARALDQERRHHLNVHVVPRFDLPVWGRIALEGLRRRLQQERPDLIHVQSWRVLPAGTWLARALGLPVVVTVHDHVPAAGRRAFDHAAVQRIVAVSDAVRSELLGRVRLSGDDVCVLHSGVETRHDVELRPVLDVGHVPVLGTAGPLESVKGHPFFLGAAQRILADGRDVEFLVAGAGPEEDNLRRLARRLGIGERVTFVPNMPDFTASLAAMDVFCLPSIRQGLGTIMLEAMSLGRPVIATGVGGVDSIVKDGEAGLLVPPCDSAKLADRMRELLDDPVRARSLGETGRRLVRQQFSAEAMTRGTVQLYRDVVRETAAGDPSAAPSGEAVPANR